MWPSQRKWWNLNTFIRVFLGGYGAGKTFQLCRRMTWCALKNGTSSDTRAPVPNIIVSPTYTVAKETVLSTMIELLDGMSAWYRFWSSKEIMKAQLTYEYRKSTPYEFVITFKREGYKKRVGRILIYSGEHPEKLKGPNIGSAGLDEPFIMDKAVFTQMVARCRSPRAVVREVNLSGTPETLNWGYDLCEGELFEQYQNTGGVGVVTASTLENKALPESYIHRLRSSLSPKAARAYIGGEFVNLTAGMVYYAFDKREHVVKMSMPKHAVLGVGMDFNVNPMSGAVFWADTTPGHEHIHFFDEIELPESDTWAMCDLLRGTYAGPGWIKPYCASDENDVERLYSGLRDVYPDSNVGRHTSSPGGKTDYDILEEEGFEVHRRIGGNADLADRYNCVNGMLRCEEDDEIRMTFDPRCKKMIKYMSTLTHEILGQRKGKSMGHLLDARDYPVVKLFPNDLRGLRFHKVYGT